MLDIKKIRENPEYYIAETEKKYTTVSLKDVLAIDEERLKSERNTMSKLIGMALLLASFSFAAYSGTPKTPSKVDGCYQIDNAEELYGFAELVNDTTSGFTQDSKTCVKLTADIVVNEKVLIDESQNKSDSLIPWTPIKVFYGTFDGQGHIISGLYTPNSNSVFSDAGLFRSLIQKPNGDPVIIKNLNIVDSYFNGYFAGAIAAEATSKNDTSNLLIENCSVQALIEGESAGGFLGLVTKNITIKNSSHSGKISGPSSASYAAGFIGLFHSGEAFIINSYHIGYVGSALWSSGLIGLIGGDFALRTIVHIENSFCTCSNRLINEKGIKNEVYITNSFYKSDCSSETTKTEAEFKDGTVALALHYGKDGDVWGQKIGTDAFPTHSGSITGLSGYAKKSNIKFHTYDDDSATYRSEYAEGISTTTPIPSRKNHLFEGWYTNPQFTDNAVTAITTADTGDLDFYAHWLAIPNYKNGCYEIANEDDLRVFVAIVNGMFNMDQNMYACGKLTADIIWNKNINKNAKPWVPMNLFKGTLDGQGHKISGIYISSPHSSSYIRYAFIISAYGDSEESPVTIKNIGLENYYIEGEAKTGGIAGSINGHALFENIYLTGRIVPGGYESAFIASSIDAKISITNSYFASNQEGWLSGLSLLANVSESSELSIINSFFYSPNRGTAFPYKINGNVVIKGKVNLTNFYVSDSLYADTTTYSILYADSTQFADGTIAKALHDYNENGIDGSIWGQSIGKDLYPVHTGKIDTVTITSSSSSKATSSSSTANSSSSKGKSSSGKTSIPSKHSVENANITTRGTTIFVEQYTGLVTVFDLNGNLVRDTYSNSHAEIRLQRVGTYIVRIGAKSRRISLTSGH